MISVQDVVDHHPQKTIQSMDQIPVPAPIAQAWNVGPAGDPQMVIAMMMVTTAPMITASQAVSRMTARSTSNNASGSSATRVLPRVEFNG
jgi:predicted metal-binding membrane protein